MPLLGPGLPAVRPSMPALAPSVLPLGPSMPVLPRTLPILAPSIQLNRAASCVLHDMLRGWLSRHARHAEHMHDWYFGVIYISPCRSLPIHC